MKAIKTTKKLLIPYKKVLSIWEPDTETATSTQCHDDLGRIHEVKRDEYDKYINWLTTRK